MVVTAVILALAGLGLSTVRHAIEERDLTVCASHLRQIGIALNAYAEPFRVYPAAAPPLGFGDLHNWGDRYSETNPPEYAAFSNTTRQPRIPRILTLFLDDLTAFVCPCPGASGFWPEVGPYYYNVTSPWMQETLPDGRVVTDYGRWMPRHALPGGERHALAACQNPDRSGQAYGSWRHVARAPSDPDGANLHLLAGGSVHRMRNPRFWTDSPPSR